MQPIFRDTAGIGILFWLIGYIAGIVLFFTPFKATMGWILLVIFTPITVGITWWWFRQRENLSLQYFAGTGVVWALIAIVFDYLFIVMLFRAEAYYSLHIYLYYLLMFLIPVIIGIYLKRGASQSRTG